MTWADVLWGLWGSGVLPIAAGFGLGCLLPAGLRTEPEPQKDN